MSKINNSFKSWGFLNSGDFLVLDLQVGRVTVCSNVELYIKTSIGIVHICTQNLFFYQNYNSPLPFLPVCYSAKVSLIAFQKELGQLLMWTSAIQQQTIFRLSQAIASPRRILNMFKIYRSSLATMAANFNWSEAAEDTLIEMWRERPPLFNIELSAYHNRVTKDYSSHKNLQGN